MGIFSRSKKPAPVEETPAASPAIEEQPEPVSIAEGAEPEAAPETAPRRGIFARLKQGLNKTTQLLRTDIRDLFKSEGRLVDDAFLEDLRGILVRTDMGPQAASQIVQEIGTQFRARVVQLAEVLDVIKDKLKQLMAQDEAPLNMASAGPTIIMVCGVNGSGKTTSIAKLAQLFTEAGKEGRAWGRRYVPRRGGGTAGHLGQRLGCEVVKGAPKSDPASVAFAAVKQAIDTGADVCIVDTAGRLQTQQNLMAELSKIHRVIGKQIPEAPHEVLLVLDATAGQNGISQARGFSEAVKCTGHCVGEDRRHGERGRDRADSPAIRPAGEAGRRGRKGRRFGHVPARRIRGCHVRGARGTSGLTGKFNFGPSEFHQATRQARLDSSARFAANGPLISGGRVRNISFTATRLGVSLVRPCESLAITLRKRSRPKTSARHKPHGLHVEGARCAQGS